MKKTTIGVLAFLTLLSLLTLCACGNNPKDEGAAVTVLIRNRVPDRLSVLAASWSIDGNTIGMTGVEIAGGSVCLGDVSVFSYINADDISGEKDLQKLEMTIKVTEKDGETINAAVLSLPSEYGDRYELELRFEDGRYSVWQMFSSDTAARLAN